VTETRLQGDERSLNLVVDAIQRLRLPYIGIGGTCRHKDGSGYVSSEGRLSRGL